MHAFMIHLSVLPLPAEQHFVLAIITAVMGQHVIKIRGRQLA